MSRGQCVTICSIRHTTWLLSSGFLGPTGPQHGTHIRQSHPDTTVKDSCLLLTWPMHPSQSALTMQGHVAEGSAERRRDREERATQDNHTLSCLCRTLAYY